jgi:hypothetical protein
MLNRVNDPLSRAVCFVFGHQFYREVYKGQIGRIPAGKLGSRVVPIIEREPVDYCMRCGEALTPSAKRRKPANKSGM